MHTYSPAEDACEIKVNLYYCDDQEYTICRSVRVLHCEEMSDEMLLLDSAGMSDFSTGTRQVKVSCTFSWQ